MTEAQAIDGVADRLELTAPAIAGSVDLAHHLLEHLWATHPEVSDLCRVRMETAAIEIMSNIVEHAFARDRASGSDHGFDARRLGIVMAVDHPQVLVSFCDNGLPAAIDLSNVAMPDEEAESGRGLAMAKASVDELTYRTDGGRNYWSLRCEDR